MSNYIHIYIINNQQEATEHTQCNYSKLLFKTIINKLLINKYIIFITLQLYSYLLHIFIKLTFSKRFTVFV